MAQTDTGNTSPGTPKNPLFIAQIGGRIVSQRSYKARDGSRQFTTILKTPAPDQFTSPGTLELRSAGKLGEPGDDITARVRITGFGRSYAVTDADTGEKRTVQTADNHLNVVTE